MMLRFAKLQNLLWRCSFEQTAQFAVSVYSRVIHNNACKHGLENRLF